MRQDGQQCVKDSKMIPLVVLLGIASSFVVQAESQECTSCILLNTTCYNISYVLDLQANFRKRVVIPKMAILRSKNILFYSYEPVFEDEEYYKIGFQSLDNESSVGILNIFGGQILNLGTFDIDQDSNSIYFGGSEGIFVLDTNLNKMSFYSSREDSITNIFYKNRVFFTKNNERGIVFKKGSEFITLYDNILAKNFVITKYDVFVILHNTGLFVVKGEERHKISGNAFFRGITMDLEGTVYTWWIDGIYKVVIKKNLRHSKVVRVAVLPDIGAMTFDNDNNILFTSDKSLYVMKQSKTGCSVGEE
ncbi:unnamed protein product [Arctia plantaginis]|uniref:Ommochrome-binding protein-like n=1 Tax=Arctia plantaginis TaxID=874455 RepID=A0A8S0YZA6_ARCPL|nr:unnamed protein product [Arctia plantaginis]